MRPAAAPSESILIVDDEEAAVHSVRRTLQAHGFECIVTCTDSREVMGLLEKQQFSLLLLDLVMPHVDGEEILSEVVKLNPDLPVIVVTGQHEVSIAVRCMKLGAADYLTKPVEGAELVATVERSLEQGALRYECARLREQFFEGEIKNPAAFEEIITSNDAMLRLFGYIEAISRGWHPVLITGETGTGKELVARALHVAGNRSGPFVAVNVAGLDDAMFSDTLFGHKPGAYTGAETIRKGMIDRAGEGTLFLDEVGDLAEASQVKLLRLLQEREYYPLGSDVVQQVRSRVVAATQRDPSTLRQDLYYRLRAYHVRVPPLRERLGDLPLLVDRFLRLAAEDLGKSKPAVPAELFMYLSNYDFPGNVRELQSMVFDAVARHKHGVIPLESFLDVIEASRSQGVGPRESPARDKISFPFPFPTMRQIEDAAAAEALDRVRGNQSAAARMLGVSRPTMGRLASRLSHAESKR